MYDGLEMSKAKHRSVLKTTVGKRVETRGHCSLEAFRGYIIMGCEHMGMLLCGRWLNLHELMLNFETL